MTGEAADFTVANQVELAIRRLDSLSILPSVATVVLSHLARNQTPDSRLAEIIESDPALVARFFRLIREQGLVFRDDKNALRRLLDKLPAQAVHEAFFPVKVLQGFEEGPGSRMWNRKQCLVHSIAAACCARDIAEGASPRLDPQTAYLAGLLHDVGKIALDEVMPRSFTRIAEEAKSRSCSSRVVEQEHLGTDHTLLGKHLGQRWRLPDEIIAAVWLHHSDAVAISQKIPQAGMAQVVRLADTIARQCGLGESGSYDSGGSVSEIAKALGISDEYLGQIRRDLPEEVDEKCRLLGLDLANAAAGYAETIQNTAAGLYRSTAKLSTEARRLQTVSSHFDFMREFILSVRAENLPAEILENFAVRWQKFYQTGMVCAYLLPAPGGQRIQAVLVEKLSQAKTLELEASADIPVIPDTIANKFDILDADEHLEWLFEQLDVDFDASQTKLLPLLSGGTALAALAFELRYPQDITNFRVHFEAAASIAGAVVDMALNGAKQQHFAEQFAGLISATGEKKVQVAAEKPPSQIPAATAEDDSLSVLAEVAAGAAHELNNPLSVISGRAQLLWQAETDPQKKRMLTHIQDNAAEISAIIDDLMSFAEPPAPMPASTKIKQILDEAIELAGQKTKADHINVQIDTGTGAESIFVDSAQIASAIANVICNCLESYTGTLGPIRIAAEADASGDFAIVQISDLGCGMDTATVRKATQPFFSARPAGRKRGMGLAHARRLVELNKGLLQITSESGAGTTVIISLPCK